jgi:predicted alpha/beta-fold hydrolase
MSSTSRFPPAFVRTGWLRRSLFVVSALVGITLVVILVEFVLMRGRTPAIRDDSGSVIPGSIASLERLRIGGVEQYVLIRGHDRRKPLLLFLHGGPGMPSMYLAHAFQRELERDFVVVHRDRRGAGKSYAALGPEEIPTVSQTLADTLELTRHLRERFGHETIYLAGHSWGSYLGILAVRERPEY